MSTQLIAHLKKKCEADDNVKILLSQWEFDQKLVGKALENIGGFYPHFSNHNASHSQQILVNIERILGKDIELLSGTDTWLILEAAYWHDIGMLVDAKSAKEVHGNKDFLFMVKTIAQDKGHDLHAFCAAYKENDWVAAIGSEDHPFDGVEKYRQLIAEWFRRNHDKRIGGLVEDPFKFLNITSPRTELLPKRIYRYLGQICMSHGMSFTDVIEKLPFKQTGLGTEDCHPRFIGCLLRLGDLFDLDDNRFCPVMAKHVSHQPNMSKAHEDKHLSLREFQLDRRTVKLVAECPDEMSYIETQNWFGWIREEFQNQMSQWNLIVPSLGFGSLPTIEQLDVKMVGNKVLLNNKPMKFSIDENNAMEILEGSGIYKNDTNIYRELIQNAIDATMLKVWTDHEKGRINLPKFSHPFEVKTQEILKNYPIKVSFNKIEDIPDSDDAWWEFKIEDKGIGIGLTDLEYMQKVAGSSKNIERQKIIDRMPKWMQPSGQFGIGLHSAFLLLKDLNDDDQKITIISTSSNDNRTYRIDFNSPLNSKNGYCFIEKTEDSISDIGTILILKLKKKRRGMKYSSNYSKLYKKLFSEYDPLKCEYYDYLSVATDIDGIYSSILSHAFLPFHFNEKWSDLINVVYPEKLNNLSELIWIDKYSLYFNIGSEFKTCLNQMSGCIDAGFRGQNVESLSYYYQPFNFYLMFYGLNAKSTLQVSRNKWLLTFEKDFIDNKFLHTLCEYVFENKRTDLMRILKTRQMFDLFCFIFITGCGDRNSWKEIDFLRANISPSFKNEKSKLYNASFNNFLNVDSFNLHLVNGYNSNTIDMSKLCKEDVVYPGEINGWLKHYFNTEWIEKGGLFHEDEESGCRIIKYSKKRVKGIDENEIKLANIIKRAVEMDDRRIILSEEWLSSDFFKGYESLFTSSYLVRRLIGGEFKIIKHMILPFIIFKESNPIVVVDYLENEELINETWRARGDEFENLTLSECKKLYEECEIKILKLVRKIYPELVE